MKLPEAVLQQHIAVLGKNGSGKTYAAKAVIVEPLLAAGKRVAIVDPTSAWWGLRFSADGRGAGFKILVLGGDHGDLPLPALGGAAVARLVVEQGVNLVADTSSMTVGERTRWMIDFAGALYRLNRTPLHLVVDEAHVFCPQGKVPDPDTGKMLHAVNQIAAGGRSRGIRLTMLTQRPQKLHKDALTTADTLIAMRVLAPQDREAVKAWIDGCGDLAQGKQVLDSLAQLQRGEGWVWYPEGRVLQCTKFPTISTFDSSATPVDGGPTSAPKGAAEIDLTEIRAALADAVKEAEANDPKLLRARIAELERQLAKPRAAAVDTAALDRARLEGRGEALRAMRGWFDRLHMLKAALAEHIDGAVEDLSRAVHQVPEICKTEANYSQIIPGPTPGLRKAESVSLKSNGATHPAAAGLGNTGKRRMLIALAQNPSGLTGRKLSILTGISQGGGTWRTYLAELRTNGWAEGGRDELRITAAGLAVLGAYDPLPTGEALQEYWRARLGNTGKTKILDTLIAYYPESVPAEAVAAETGIAIAGGTWRTYLAELRSLELVEGARSALRASAELFD